MKKSIKLITALTLCAVLLSSCSASNDEVSEPTQSSSISTETANTTSLINHDLETSESITSVTLPANASIEDIYTHLSLDKEGVTLTGEPLTSDKLEKFKYILVNIEEEQPVLYEFVESLKKPEITDLCIRAESLTRIFSNELLYVIDECRTRKIEDEIYLDASAIGKSSYYIESGVEFDSFAESYVEVFTKSALDKAFARYKLFGCYNKQLWYVQAAATGNITAVNREYELITNTESEVLFREIVYCIEQGEPLVFDPEKKNEYSTYTLDYKFVMTENGWRTEEFPVYDRTLDGSAPWEQ